MESTSPFLDDMSLIKDKINDIISKLLLSPQILKVAIIEEKLWANNNELVVINLKCSEKLSISW